MNIYDKFNNPEELDHFESIDTEIIELFWNKYENNKDELKNVKLHF